jgi:hypothetical protein
MGHVLQVEVIYLCIALALLPALDVLLLLRLLLGRGESYYLVDI